MYRYWLPVVSAAATNPAQVLTPAPVTAWRWPAEQVCLSRIWSSFSFIPQVNTPITFASHNV